MYLQRQRLPVKLWTSSIQLSRLQPLQKFSNQIIAMASASPSCFASPASNLGNWLRLRPLGREPQVSSYNPPMSTSRIPIPMSKSRLEAKMGKTGQDVLDMISDYERDDRHARTLVCLMRRTRLWYSTGCGCTESL